MIQLAVYGKGGIGKSTISSNLSYALSLKGVKVLQVGCDPKHDSTRNLMDGKSQQTVLEYIRDTVPAERKAEDIIIRGVNGIGCVEAGGPEPGIGCAGRGILSTFDTLEKMGVDDMGFDVRLYDVLGDVVCGGFAVPMRREYADAILIVTSGEFMSMYAANNILRGILNYDKDRPRVAGIVLNCRGIDGEADTVRRFADSLGLPIVATIPRCNKFTDAEMNGKCFSEVFPDHPIAGEFRNLADLVIRLDAGDAELYCAHPLTDDGMTKVALGACLSGDDTYRYKAKPKVLRISGRKLSEKDILYFCAASGAVNATVSMKDCVTLIHGPMSCGSILSSSVGYGTIPVAFGPDLHVSRRVFCTGMDDSTAIFGGNWSLEKSLTGILDQGVKTVFVVTTCTPGIIGDDSENIAADLSERYGAEIKIIKTDGNILGDWIEGYIEAAGAMAELIDPDVEPEEGTVNLIGERYYHTVGDDDGELVRGLLEPFGLRINCRFMFDTTSQQVREFRKGKYSIAFGQDPYTVGVCRKLKEKADIDVISVNLPRGRTETLQWADDICRLTGRSASLAEDFKKKVSEEYETAFAGFRKKTSGQRMMIYNKLSYRLDWLIEILRDLDIEIVMIDDFTGSITRGSRYLKDGDTVDMEEADFVRKVGEVMPDFVMTDSAFTEYPVPFLKYYTTKVGIQDSILFAEQISRITNVPASEGWRRYR